MQSLNVIKDVLMLQVSVNCFPVPVIGSFPARSQISIRNLSNENSRMNKTDTCESSLVLRRLD